MLANQVLPTLFSEILRKQNVLHAIIDMDYLRYVFPRPENDPFHRSLSAKNLASIWQNYKAIGVNNVIIPNVVEDRTDVEAIAKAITDSEITVVRLRASIETIHKRLHERHGKRDNENLQWHLNRAEELTTQLEDTDIENFIVDTDNKSLDQIANEILSQWNK